MQSQIPRRNGQEPQPAETNREPSGQRSAIITLPGNKSAPHARLLGEFGHRGFTFTQLKRVGAVAIYQQTKNGQTPAFEVVVVRKREASFIFGKELPATEYYPRNEEWGAYGFTYRSFEDALTKLGELALPKGTKSKP